MTYEVNGWVKFLEEDVFSDGCLPETSQMTNGRDRFVGATVDDLIKVLNEFTGNNDADAILLDACGEPGRVDIEVMETSDGYPAAKSVIAAWREGERRLWLACYSFRVEQVERRTVAIAA